MDFIIRRNRLDIEAINALKELKLEERSVAVIHLMSCHAPYQVRYPDGFREDLSKRYERATAYLDYVLSELFAYAMNNDFIDGVIFVPDHGEDVVLGDHDSAIFTPDMTRIPMIKIQRKNAFMDAASPPSTDRASTTPPSTPMVNAAIMAFRLLRNFFSSGTASH